MKHILFITMVTVTILISGCCNESGNTNETTITVAASQNALLPTSVIMHHRFEFNPERGKEWLASFDNEKFIADVTEAAKEGKIKVCDYIDFSLGHFVPMSTDDVKKVLKKEPEKVEIMDPETKETYIHDYPGLTMDQLNQLYVKEEWFLDKDNFRFDKKVLGYGIVKEYLRSPDSDRKERKVLFVLDFENDSALGEVPDISKLELIGSDLKYEFSLNEVESWVKDLDHDRLINLVMDKIKSGEVKPYDFWTGEELTLARVKDLLSIPNDTVMVEDPETGEVKPEVIQYDVSSDLFQSYIFIEDWYLDRATYRIVKKVKGFAPVSFVYRDEESSEPERKVTFMVKFNQ